MAARNEVRPGPVRLAAVFAELTLGALGTEDDDVRLAFRVQPVGAPASFELASTRVAGQALQKPHVEPALGDSRREHDVPEFGAAGGMAGREHETGVTQHPELGRPYHNASSHFVARPADPDLVATMELREVQERMRVRRPVPCDADRVLVAVVQPGAALELRSHRHVEVQPRDHEPR